MKKFLVVLLSLFVVVSCGKDDEIENQITNKSNQESNKNIDSDKNGIISEIKNDTPKISGETQKLEINYNKKKDELVIGNLTITKGFPESLKGELTGYKDEQTYINSNINDYFFFSSSDDKKDIVNKYKKELLSNKWQVVKDSQDTSYKKDNKILDISVGENIPENLKDLNLVGKFVEITLTKIPEEVKILEIK